MSGIQNIQGAQNAEFLRDKGIRPDDGLFDLASAKVLSVEAVVTLAQLNAGAVLVPEVPGRVYRPLGFFVKMNGTFTTCTDMRISDTNSAPVDIVTIVVAQMGTGLIHTEDAGTHTLGAGLMADLTAGKGIQIRKTGSTAAGGTDILVRIFYRIAA